MPVKAYCSLATPPLHLVHHAWVMYMYMFYFLNFELKVCGTLGERIHCVYFAGKRG